MRWLRSGFVLVGLLVLSGCVQAPPAGEVPASTAGSTIHGTPSGAQSGPSESAPTGGWPSGPSGPAVAAAWQTVSDDIQAGAPSPSSGADWFAPDFTALSSAVKQHCYPALGDEQTTQLDTLRSEFDFGAASDDPSEKMLIEAATAYLERVEEWC